MADNVVIRVFTGDFRTFLGAFSMFASCVVFDLVGRSSDIRSGQSLNVTSFTG